MIPVVASVFPTMVLLEEGASNLRCRMLSGPSHVLRHRAHRLRRLVSNVPGVLGVHETIDGVLIECDAAAADRTCIRDAVRMFYSLVSEGEPRRTSGGAHD